MADEAQAADLVGMLAEEFCKSEKFRNFANTMGPKAAGLAIGTATANPVAGLAADAAVTAATKYKPETAAEVITGIALIPVVTAVLTVGSLIATPVIAGFLVYEGGKAIWKRLGG